MKKFLVVLMILAVAGGVIAQDISFSGQVEAGILFEKAGDEDLMVKPYNADADVPLRADLTTKAEWENVGAKVRFRSDFNGFLGSFDPIGNPNVDAKAIGVKVPFAFVWANVLNDMIKISAGKLDDAAWATQGDFDTQYDNTNGTRVEIKPIEGLNVGFALDIVDGAGVEIGDFFLETVIGAKFVADPVTVVAAVKLDGEADGPAPEWDDAASSYTTPAKTDEEIKALFSVNITAVPKLTAIIDGEINHINGDMGIDIHEKFGYQILDPLEAHLVLVQKGVLDSDVNPAGLLFAIKPGVSYAVIPDKFIAKLDLEFNTYTENFFDPLQIVLQPGIEWRYNETAKILGWYKGIFWTDDAVAPGAKPIHQVQVDFRWSF
jgi:hypothetical protein